MKCPLVSVGMPVLNGEKWIRRSLDALLQQNYQNIEIIISDNASSDDTFAICSEYALIRDNIRIVRHKKTVGIIDNFRVVLHSAQGKYFMWAAVDDNWDASFISCLVKKLEEDEKIAVAQTGALILAESDLDTIKDCVRFDGMRNIENLPMLQVTRKILSPIKYNYFIYGLFRKELLTEAFSFIPSVPSSDRLFLLQFPLAGYRMGYVDAPLYIRTVQDLPTYIRYQGDAYCDQVGLLSTKWFDFSGYAAIKRMFEESSLLLQCSRYVKSVVLLQYLKWKVNSGARLMVKSIILKMLPASGAVKLIVAFRRRPEVRADCWIRHGNK